MERPSLHDLMKEGYSPRVEKHIDYRGTRRATVIATNHGSPDILIGDVKMLRELQPEHLRRLVRSRFLNQVRYIGE